MNEPVEVTVHDHVATLRLNAPPLNSFDTAMRDALAAAASRLEDDESVRAVVLWGGPRCFAAGADIGALAAMAYEEVVRWNRGLQRALTHIAELPMPVVAAVEGPALGGGFELALAADQRIAGESALLGLPEVTLGIMPGSGGTQRLTALVGPSRAKQLMMTGRRHRAAEAHRLGLVDEVVPAGAACERAQEIAAELARGPRFALAAVKQAVDGAGDGLALERALIAGLFATQDKDRGMRSFLDDGPGHATFT